MTIDFISGAIDKFKELSYPPVDVCDSLTGWGLRLGKYSEGHAVALINNELVATRKKKYTGEDKRLSEARRKELLINDTPIDMDLLLIAEGDTAALRDLLPFAHHKGYQLLKDGKEYTSGILNAILGEGNYSFIMITDYHSQDYKFYLKVDIVNEYASCPSNF